MIHRPPIAYGRSKLVGRAGHSRGRWLPCHLAHLLGVFRPWCNFVKTMLRLSDSRDSLSVVADQIGGPTPARAIAAACLSIADQLRQDPAKTGTYHFSGAPDASWCDLPARYLRRPVGHACRPYSTSAYPTPAARPLNSPLDCRDRSQFLASRARLARRAKELLNRFRGAA